MKKSSLFFKKIKHGVLLLVALAVFASCVTDDIVPNASNQNIQGDRVTFSVNIPEASSVPLSRAGMSDEEENVINDIHILAFSLPDIVGRESSLKIVKSLGSKDLIKNDNSYTFETVLPKGKYDFLVLANLQTLKSNSTDTDYLKDRLTDFISMSKSDVVKVLTIHNENQDWTAIPMSGLINNVDVNGASTKPIELSLIKSLVRVDIDVDSRVSEISEKGKFAGFSLEHIVIYNYNVDGCVTPNLDGTGNLDTLDIHIPKAVKTGGRYLEHLRYDYAQDVKNKNYFTSNKVTNLLYFNESDIAGDAESDRMCVIIGARYKWSGFTDDSQYGDPVDVNSGSSDVTYYRIDFERKNENNELEHVLFLRNRNFKIKITKVNRRGYSSINEAFKAGPDTDPMLEYELVEEDVSDLGDLVFDGRNFFAVSPSKPIYGKESSKQTLVITTDFDGDVVTPKLELLEKDVSTGGNGLIPFKGDWVELENEGSPLKYDDITLNNKAARKYYVNLAFNENNLPVDREVFLSVEMGRLSKLLQIVQTNIEQIYIVVEENINGVWVPTKQLKFHQNGYFDRPENKKLRIRWSPASASVDVVDFTKPFDGILGSKYSNISWVNIDGHTDLLDCSFDESGSQEITIQPELLNVSPGDVKKGLQNLVFTVDDDLARTATATVEVVQDLRALYIDAPDYIVMDGLKKTFTIQANAPWTLTIVRNNMDEDLEELLGYNLPVVSKVNGTSVNDGSSFSLSGNILGSDYFSKEYSFIPENDIDNPSLYSGEITLKLTTSGKNTAVFEKTIKCVSAVKQNGREANCYVLDPRNKVGLLIPVQAANRQILDANRYLSHTSVEFPERQLLGGEFFNAELIWSDVQGGDDGSGMSTGLLRIVRSVGRGPKGYVLVMPNNTVYASDLTGNSLVAAISDNTREILWSWHIWSLTDVEFEGDLYNSYIKPIQTRNGAWLDRDLGAISAVPGQADSFGYYYQWGRKDPTPSPLDILGTERILYNKDNQPILVSPENGSGSVTLKAGSPGSKAEKMIDALQNPLVFYMSTYWDTKWLNSNATDLWYANGKTIYDPCPAGYRVPAYNTNSSWFLANNWQMWDTWSYGVYWLDSKVFYPASGFRGSYDGWGRASANISKISKEGYRQSAYSAKATNAKTIHFTEKIKPGSRYGAPDKSRTLGFPVRCVKIE